MHKPIWNIIWRALPTLLPAILLTGVTIYVLNNRQEIAPQPVVLPGKPLAAFADLYPVRADANGRLFLDKELFVQTIHALKASPSPKAASDLIYLGQSNNVLLELSDSEKQLYKELISMPAYTALSDADKQRDKNFQVYRDIVNGIGQTFSGTGIEIVLHDTRNPLKSVVAIQNPISGRRLGDATTNFGLELIKNFSIVDKVSSSYVSYDLQLHDGRRIKSTTIPLFDDTYGLIGFICLNIDISKLNDSDPAAVAAFLANFKATTRNDKIHELIDNARTHTAQK